MNRSFEPQSRRSLAFVAVGILAAGAAGCDDAEQGSPKAAASSSLETSLIATLSSDYGHAVGEPLNVTIDGNGRYLVVDGSDKQVRVFASDGRQAGEVGRPGSGPGEFTALRSGGLLGDSIFGYDINGVRLSLFDTDGAFIRSASLFEPGEPMPAAVRALDDSLFLVVGFPTGAHARELLAVTDRLGHRKARFLDFRSYFTPENPDLVQSSVLYADGMDGVVFAALMGHDSVYAFDYAGRRLGAGPLALPDGSAPETFRSLIEQNGGRRTRADGRLVTEGRTAVVAVSAVSASEALLQLMPLEYDPNGRLDRTTGQTVALATLDRARGAIEITGFLSEQGAVMGRHPGGGGLVIRYAGSGWEEMEVVRIIPGGAR